MNEKTPLAVLGGTSVNLHVRNHGDAEHEGGPLLTFWVDSTPGPTFDVVDNKRQPLDHEVLQAVAIRGSKGMELLLQSLKLINADPLYKYIHEERGEWVGCDETGLELCRSKNYLEVRQGMSTYCEMLEAGEAALFPSTGDTWRHHKGNEYEVLLLSNQYSQQAEYPPTVVYQGANGKVWSKSLVNFLKKMTFVKKAEDVECGTLNVPTIGITGIRPGHTWNNDGADFPTSDIDLRYSKESGRCEAEIWYGAIHATARTAEQAEELRDLIIKGLKMATTLRDSLDFETKLAQFHEAVWDSCVSDEDYDLAGVNTAKELIAMFRGEEKYTHHLDMPIIEGLDLSKCTKHHGFGCMPGGTAEDAPILEKGEKVTMVDKEQFIEAWGAADKPVHTLLQVLNDKDQMALIAKRATEAQLTQLAEWKGEQPKTFGCHHTSETCGLCHDMVMRWKEKQAAEAPPAEPEGDHMFERFIRPCE